MAPVFIVLIIFGSIPAVILGLVHLRNKNKERMAIIEKGVDPAIFKEQFRTSKNVSLKVGIFLIGIALGIITGSIMANTVFYFPEEVSYFSSIFLFGGLSLLITFLIDRNAQKKE